MTTVDLTKFQPVFIFSYATVLQLRTCVKREGGILYTDLNDHTVDNPHVLSTVTVKEERSSEVTECCVLCSDKDRPCVDCVRSSTSSQDLLNRELAIVSEEGNERRAISIILPRKLWDQAGVMMKENNNPQIPLSPTKKNKLFTCYECNLPFKSKSSLKKHKLAHEAKKKLRCAYCSYRCVRYYYLFHHHKRKHSGKNLPEKPPPRTSYQCKKCDFIAKTQGRLWHHNQSHAKMKELFCNECDYKTAHRRCLISHQRSHTGYDPFVCKQCGFTVATFNSFDSHMRHVHKESFLSNTRGGEMIGEYLMSSQ